MTFAEQLLFVLKMPLYLLCAVMAMDAGAVQYTEEVVTSGSLLTGRITWQGPAEVMQTFRVSTDGAVCGNGTEIKVSMLSHSADRLQGLQGAVVYISDISRGAAFADDTLLTHSLLLAKNCTLHPRVTLLPLDSFLALQNGDNLLHHFRLMNGDSTVFDTQQVTQGIKRRYQLKSAGFFTLRCSRHPWEMSAVVVARHPYFAVTAADGSYAIADIPAGAYTLVAWHPPISAKPVLQKGMIKDYSIDAPLSTSKRFSIGRGAVKTCDLVVRTPK